MPGQVRRSRHRRPTRWAALLAALALLAIAPAAHAFKLKVTGPPDAPKMVFDSQMKIVSVCLPVTNPAGGQSVLYGQRVTDGPVSATTPAIVLVHGIASSMENWDFSPTWSVARALASAGYVVFSYDRLGYAASSYLDHPGGGETLTTAAHRAMLHNVVTDVKGGGYRISATGNCATPTTPGDTTSRSAIVIGHSAGGWVVSGYPGQYHDVAAMVQADISGSGSGASNSVAAGGAFTPDPAHPDYFTFFQTTQDCYDFNTYTPGVVQYAANIACTRPFLDSPFGEIADIGVKYAQNDAEIAKIGPSIPVMLTSGENDTTDPPATANADYAYYKAHCGCDVTQLLLPQTAHLFMVHKSLPTWVDHVVAWLSSHGLLGSTATAAPQISRARLTHRRFRVARRATARTAGHQGSPGTKRHRAAAGTSFHFTLSAAATVTIKVVRVRGHHRHAVGKLTRRALVAGKRAIAFSARIGPRALPPGRYRAVLTAANSSGRSGAVTLRFTIVP